MEWCLGGFGVIECKPGDTSSDTVKKTIHGAGIASSRILASEKSLIKKYLTIWKEI